MIIAGMRAAVATLHTSTSDSPTVPPGGEPDGERHTAQHEPDDRQPSRRDRRAHRDGEHHLQVEPVPLESDHGGEHDGGEEGERVQLGPPAVGEGEVNGDQVAGRRGEHRRNGEPHGVRAAVRDVPHRAGAEGGPHVHALRVRSPFALAERVEPMVRPHEPR